jgi:tape measure domain-containing protein
MSSVDQRVVEAQFKHSQFSEGVSTVLAQLAKLKEGLKLEGASQGLQEASRGMADFEGQPGRIAGGFSALHAIAFGALASIGARAIQTGQQLISAFTIEPLRAGLEEYETNMTSIQTILSNTSSAGTTLNDVNRVLDEMNHYSDQTIYNFAEMAKNVGTFTAAGVDLDTSAASIKGIANLAALSGSNSAQAGQAMYQLSQAISEGRVSLESWNSVVNAGMGGTVFQRALAQTAVAMGKIDEGAVTLTGDMKNVTVNGKSFRESIMAKPGEQSWLTSEILTNTLQQFTGDLSDAELAAQGFNQQQIDAIKQQANMARNAATEVKTFSQLMSTLKESAGSGWSQTWRLVIGDFEEAKELWTGVNNVLGGFISRSADARNEILAEWKAWGGREYLIKGVEFAFRALMDILRPIGEAFRQVFPATTGRQLADITHRFQNFTASLVPTKETVDNIRRTFAGLFAVLNIGWQFIKAGIGFLGRLFGTITEGSGGILNFTGNIGDFLVALSDAIEKGDIFGRFFDGLGNILEKPIGFIKDLIGAIGAFFGVGEKGAGAMRSFNEAGENLGRIGEDAAAAWDRVTGFLERFWQKLEPIGEGIQNFFAEIGTAIGDFVSNLSFTDILAGVGTGAFAALVLTIRKAVGDFKLSDIFSNIFGGEDKGPGFLSTVTDALGELTDTLQSMQNALNAAALLGIAAAIGILTLSVMALSGIPADDLGKAVGAIGALVTEMAIAAKIFGKLKMSDTIKLTLIGLGLIALATAVRILASAVKTLSELNWEELAKGLSATAVLLGALGLTARLMAGHSRGMIKSSAGLLILAFAIKVLVDSVQDLAEMDWEELGRGLAGVGALLLALGLFGRFAKANNIGITTGAGLLLLAAGIKVLASAVEDLSDLSWEEMARGLVGVSVGLVAIAGALKLLPKGNLLNAVAILIVATSIKILASALADMAGMSWEEVARSLVVLAGSLLIITLALKQIQTGILGAAALVIIAYSIGLLADSLAKMGDMDWGEIAKALVALGAALLAIVLAVNAMEVALPGAAALLIVAFALNILADVLVKLGEMSWSDIGAAIGSLTLLFVVLAIGGALSPLILLLAAALTVLAGAIALAGAGILAAGTGIDAFANAMTKLSQIDQEGLNRIVATCERLIALLPTLAASIALAIAAFIVTLGQKAPEMARAFGEMVSSAANEIRIRMPEVVAAFMQGLTDTLTEISNRMPALVTAGANALVNFLNGIAREMPRVAQAGANVVIAFLNALGTQIPRVVDAGFQMIIKVVNGIADSIRQRGPELRAAGANLADAIIDGMTGGITGGQSRVSTSISAMATSALAVAKSVLGIRSPSRRFMEIGDYVVQGFAKGISGNRGQIEKAAMDLFNKFTDNVRDTNEEVRKAEERFNKLQNARKKDTAAIGEAARALNQAREDQRAAGWQLEHYTRFIHDDIEAQKRLADQYDATSKKLDAANKKYADAKKVRDDYAASVKDQYNNLPDISEDTRLADYIAQFEKQIVDTQAFASALAELRRRGLNDTMYKELVAKGPSAMPFVQQLLEGGKADVTRLNTLGKSLDKAAGDISTSTSKALYQAAVDSAAGFVKGLQNQRANIQREMRGLANYIVGEIKNSLGIRSPSRVFAEIGRNSAQGLVDGLSDSRSMVGRASAQLGDDIVGRLGKTIAGLGASISEDMDLTPVITPVLDLSAISRDSSLIGDLLGDQAIDLSGAYAQTRDASAGYSANQTATAEATTPAAEPISFVQNNYSPQALTPTEIYRQTNNQLSVAKGALTNAN